MGHVVGGADTVARVLRATLETLLVPTCCWGEGSAECRAPQPEQLAQNGLNPGDGPRHVPTPFDPAVTLPVPAMGAVPRAVMRLGNVRRGQHPLTSFAAVGTNASRYVLGQTHDDPQFPLKQLEADDGLVLLLGVNLTRCTALHVAEERVGRRPFVRYVLGSSGEPEPVRIGGCSEGFERLWPSLGAVFTVLRIGEAEARVARLSALLSRAAELIRADPKSTRCDLVNCPRCRDALLGGPVRIH
jgi:hypothetical protein